MADALVGKADLKPGQLKCVTANGKKLALANVGGAYSAMDNPCPHAGGPLCEGSLDAKGVVECPWHGSQFDARTGRVVRGPATAPVKTYVVKEKNGELFVQL